ncbi:MAG: hypothetical protein EOO75_01145 [Myxococcales bacterium]|nr:MAG: hypothetical protein EOO75_01145 [Myxococcales bacterium]
MVGEALCILDRELPGVASALVTMMDAAGWGEPSVGFYVEDPEEGQREGWSEAVCHRIVWLSYDEEAADEGEVLELVAARDAIAKAYSAMITLNWRAHTPAWSAFVGHMKSVAPGLLEAIVAAPPGREDDVQLRLGTEGMSHRRRFLSAYDGHTQCQRTKAVRQAVGRDLNERQLACIILAAGDFPKLQESDRRTVASVIRNMKRQVITIRARQRGEARW